MTLDGEEIVFHVSGERLDDNGALVTQPTCLVVTSNRAIEGDSLSVLCEKLNELGVDVGRESDTARQAVTSAGASPDR